MEAGGDGVVSVRVRRVLFEIAEMRWTERKGQSWWLDGEGDVICRTRMMQ
jgi:hypothetical protein